LELISSFPLPLTPPSFPSLFSLSYSFSFSVSLSPSRCLVGRKGEGEEKEETKA